MWSVRIESKANASELSISNISDILCSFHHKDYTAIKNDLRRRLLYGQAHPSASWQLKKAFEVEDLFHTSVEFSKQDDECVVVINFQIEFTEGFTEHDVVNWVEGMSRFAKIRPFIMGKYNHDGVHTSSVELEFLYALIANEKIKVFKLRDDPRVLEKNFRNF